MAKKEEPIELYTDGSYKHQVKKGGYAAYLPHIETVICGSEENTTNNKMELQAVISGLRAIESNKKVVVYTDSQYVCNGFNKGWVKKWEQDDWKRKDEYIPNHELWMQLKHEVETHKKVEFQWVKGHASTHGNNLCDAFATAVTHCD